MGEPDRGDPGQELPAFKRTRRLGQKPQERLCLETQTWVHPATRPMLNKTLSAQLCWPGILSLPLMRQQSCGSL